MSAREECTANATRKTTVGIAACAVEFDVAVTTLSCSSTIATTPCTNDTARPLARRRSMTPTTDPTTLTKAVVRAAERLGLTNDVPQILGIETAAWNAIVRGDGTLDASRPEWLAATNFASLFRSLLTLVGTLENARAWLSTPHQTLGTEPTTLLRTPEGRERVFRYLDAVQKFEMKLPPRGRPH